MKVSVIIPTYNRAQLVTQTIDSVLAQSFQDFELIVIDDGSPDATAQKLAVYGDRIRYVYQRNMGLNHARNHAISLAQGEYISVLDDDDLWCPHKLAIQVKILDQFPELAFTFSNFAIYKNENNICFNGIQSWYKLPVIWADMFERTVFMAELGDGISDLLPVTSNMYIGSIYHSSLSHYYVLPSTATFRRSLVPAGVNFTEHDPICGDWDFFARLSRDHPVAYLDYETAFNRSHEDEFRLTRTSWKKQLEFRIDMLERLYLKDKEFLNKHLDEVNTVYRSRLIALSRQYLIDNDKELMHKLLKKYRNYFSSYDASYLSLSLASHLPGLNKILRSLRSLRS